MAFRAQGGEIVIVSDAIVTEHIQAQKKRNEHVLFSSLHREKRKAFPFSLLPFSFKFNQFIHKLHQPIKTPFFFPFPSSKKKNSISNSPLSLTH